MKELRGSATAEVSASPDECVALLEDIEGYPSWYPDVVRRAEIVRPSGDGGPTQARTRVHLGVGPIQRDFDLLMEVTSETGGVIRLARIGHDDADSEELSATWRIGAGSPGGRTRIAVDVTARLEVPRLLPLGGIGDAVARDFVSAAARELDRR
jgi:Polyketide cyclase / dehydrase and lipid transport